MVLEEIGQIPFSVYAGDKIAQTLPIDLSVFVDSTDTNKVVPWNLFSHTGKKIQFFAFCVQ